MPTTRKAVAKRRPRGFQPSTVAAVSATGLQPHPSTDPAHPDRIPKGLFVGRAVGDVVDRFEAEIGGRQILLDALLLSPDLSPEMEDLLGALADPRLQEEPLSRLAAGVGLRPGAVFAAFRDADLGRSTIASLRKIADQLPRITASVLLAAVDHERTCPECRGDKVEVLIVTAKPKKGQSLDPAVESEVTIRCRTCKGRGTVFVEADPDRQDRVLEMAGLLQKGGGGISINQSNVNVANKAEIAIDAADGLAQLQQAVSGILFNKAAAASGSSAPSAVIDVDPVPTAEGPPA